MFATQSSEVLVCACVRGLDQRVALPRDSYLQAYFGDVTSALRVGPPLFLVVRDLNLSTAAPDVDRVCSVAGCDDGSLVNQVSSQSCRAKRRPHGLHVAFDAATVAETSQVHTLDMLHIDKAAVSGTRCIPSIVTVQLLISIGWSATGCEGGALASKQLHRQPRRIVAG